VELQEEWMGYSVTAPAFHGVDVGLIASAVTVTVTVCAPLASRAGLGRAYEDPERRRRGSRCIMTNNFGGEEAQVISFRSWALESVQDGILSLSWSKEGRLTDSSKSRYAFHTSARYVLSLRRRVLNDVHQVFFARYDLVHSTRLQLSRFTPSPKHREVVDEHLDVTPTALMGALPEIKGPMT
jgi:hypothetical protein